MPVTDADGMESIVCFDISFLKHRIMAVKFVTIIRDASHEKLSSGFQTRSNTNRAVPPQKITRSLKFQIKKIEGLYMYYLCSKDKGTDQLHSYPAADLCLCFHICKKQIFSIHSSY